MADGVALGVQALQDAQRAAVPVAQHAAAGLQGVSQAAN